jgi:small subunit ribosomal protein S20
LANIKSAIKRVRQSARRRVRNRIVRSSMRTFVKKARTILEEGDTAQAAGAVREAISALDKAAQKGIIHRNSADRRKSRLMKRLSTLEKPTATE